MGNTQKPRRAVVIALTTVLAAMLLGGAWLLLAKPWVNTTSAATPTADATPTPTSTPTPIAAATGDPTSPPVEPSTTARPIPPELEPASPSSPVEAPGDVTVSLVLIESVQGIGAAPGETSGPAIRVTVRIENRSDAPLPASYVAVNAYLGDDRSPAAPVMQPGGSPFDGEVAAGQTAEGVYLFSVPADDRSDVRIGVDYQAGMPTVVFAGDLH